jgi:hypothetical protein
MTRQPVWPEQHLLGVLGLAALPLGFAGVMLTIRYLPVIIAWLLS